jgi:hypothetical protein
MRFLRIFSGMLLLLPLGFYFADAAMPTPIGRTNYLEIGFLVTGLPVILLNYLAWFAPESLDFIASKFPEALSGRPLVFASLAALGFIGFFAFFVGTLSSPAPASGVGYVPTSAPRLPTVPSDFLPTDEFPVSEGTPNSEGGTTLTESPSSQSTPEPGAVTSPTVPVGQTQSSGPVATATTVVVTVPVSTPITAKTFTGSDNAKIDLRAYTAPVIIEAEHTGNSTFLVYLVDEAGEQIDTLFEAPDAYKGQRLINVGGVTVPYVEIETTGAWKISVLPVSSAPALPVPGAYEGEDARVVRLMASLGDIVLQAGSAESDYIIVIGYGDADYAVWLIDEEVPDNKTFVIDDPQVKYLEVIALGSWRMEAKP